jgi:O-antigen/teichoic acid export membrane protein
VSLAVSTPRQDPATKNPLPEGTIAVGVGLVISGISAFVFLGIAKRAIGDDPYVALGQLWFLTFWLAPGFFLPVEQEVGRALAHRRTHGQGGLPVIKKAAILGVGLAIVLLAGMLATSPLLVEHQLHGSWPLMVGLILGVLGFGSTYIVRGTLSGSGDFPRFGLLLGADGMIRVVAGIVLYAAGVHAPGAYGLLVGLPPFIAIGLAIRGRRSLLVPGPEAPWRELTPNLGWLVVGSVLMAALMQAGPIAANMLSDNSEKQLVSAFTNGVLVARLPLFLFQAVQSALLPKLAKLAATGAIEEFKRGFTKLMTVVAIVGAAGVVGAGVLGPKAVSVAYESDLSRRTMALVALGAALYMGAVAMTQALIALHCHAKVAMAWALGLAAFVLGTAFVAKDLLLRVELGFVIGSAASMVAAFFMLRRALASGVQPDAGSLAEAIYDLPLEA